MVEQRRIAYAMIFLVALMLSIIYYDRIQNILNTWDLITLVLVLGGAGAFIFTLPKVYNLIVAKLFHRIGHRKILDEKETEKKTLEFANNNLGAHSVAGHIWNVAGQHYDGDQYDNPYAWVALTTEKQRGIKKLRLDEISYDKLFFIHVDRLTGNCTYEPMINTEEEANILLRQLRENALPFDKIRNKTEAEKLIEKELLGGYGRKTGEEIAKEKR